MKIMIVDDNAIVRAGLRAVLTRVDSVTEVVEAEDAFAALETAASESPEIVLLDISMPGRSGLDILPELVAHGGTWCTASWALTRSPVPSRPVGTADSSSAGRRPRSCSTPPTPTAPTPCASI